MTKKRRRRGRRREREGEEIESTGENEKFGKRKGGRGGEERAALTAFWVHLILINSRTSLAEQRPSHSAKEKKDEEEEEKEQDSKTASLEKNEIPNWLC